MRDFDFYRSVLKQNYINSGWEDLKTYNQYYLNVYKDLNINFLNFNPKRHNETFMSHIPYKIHVKDETLELKFLLDERDIPNLIQDLHYFIFSSLTRITVAKYIFKEMMNFLNIVWVTPVLYNVLTKINYQCFIREYEIENQKWYLFGSIDAKGYIYTDKINRKVKNKQRLINKINKGRLYDSIK